MRKAIDIVQLLRGLAAILVCLFHMKGILPENKLGQTLFGNGSIGVPLFFMISGFIMYHTTWQVQPDWRYLINYLKKRLIRIIPLYYLCSLLSITILDQWSYYIQYHPERLLSALFFYPTFHVLLGPSYGFPPLAVGWSLNYEMYFYALIGLAMFLNSRRWLGIVVFLLFFVFVLPLLNFGYTSNNLGHAYPFKWLYLNLMCNPVLLFFLTGILAGMVYNRKTVYISLWPANMLVIAGFVVFAMNYAGFRLPLPGFWSPLFSCGLLLFGCLLRDRAKPIKLPDLLLFPGDISYSVYLIHPLIITGIPRLKGFWGIQFQTTGCLYFAFIFMFILLISHHSHRLVEQKLGKWLLTKAS